MRKVCRNDLKSVLVISVVYVFINVLYLVLDFLLGALYKHIDTVGLVAIKATPRKPIALPLGCTASHSS